MVLHIGFLTGTTKYGNKIHKVRNSVFVEAFLSLSMFSPIGLKHAMMKRK